MKPVGSKIDGFSARVLSADEHLDKAIQVLSPELEIRES